MKKAEKSNLFSDIGASIYWKHLICDLLFAYVLSFILVLTLFTIRMNGWHLPSVDMIMQNFSYVYFWECRSFVERILMGVILIWFVIDLGIRFYHPEKKLHYLRTGTKLLGKNIAPAAKSKK